MKNNSIIKLLLNIIYKLFLFGLWIFAIYVFLTAYQAYNLQKDMEQIKNTPWVIVNSGDVVIETFELEREYLDYIMEHWEAWVDFFVATPTDQPNLKWKTSQENNEKMWSYLSNNKILFDLPNTDKQWYIMFITSKKVPENRDIFLWVDWKTVWHIRKEKSLTTKTDNEYLFQLDSIPIVWYQKTWDENVYGKSLNAVVWQANNKIEKIIIFFK